MTEKGRKRLLLRSLEATRFEDLVASLVFPLAHWVKLHRTDAKPTGGSPSLLGVEVISTGLQRTWWVKVARADSGAPRQLASLSEPLFNALPSTPDVLLLVLDYDVPEATIQRWREHVGARGVNHAFVWTARDVERRLWSERPDLLFAYFGVSSFRRLQQKMRTIRRRLNIKKRLLSDLLRPAESRVSASERPFEKFLHAKVVLRSLDDESYPKSETRLGIARGWLEVDTYDVYHGGLEVVVATVDVVMDADGRWSPVPMGYVYDQSRFQSIRAFEVGRIPYDHIVEYDLAGDEFYREPHVFCLFAGGGLPFSEFRYYAVEDPYRVRLLPEKMVGLVDVAGDPEAESGNLRAAGSRRAR